MNVLVTGGAGFVGSHLVRCLFDKGYNVTVLDNLMRGKKEYIKDLIENGVRFVDGDVRYQDCVDSVMEGQDYVFHEAATNINRSMAYPEESFDVNFKGSHIVFKSALNHNVKKVIFASSASVYGQPKQLPMKEDTELYPITPYCVSKLASEGLLKFFSRQGLKFVALRYFNIYGLNQQSDAYYTSVIIRFIKNVVKGKPPVINGSGEQSMDFINVKDVVQANLKAMEKDVENEIVNVGTGDSTSVKDVASYIIEISGKKLSPIFKKFLGEELVTERRADIEKARNLLGFKPTVDLMTGMEEIFNDVVRNPGGY